MGHKCSSKSFYHSHHGDTTVYSKTTMTTTTTETLIHHKGSDHKRLTYHKEPDLGALINHQKLLRFQ